MADAKSETGMMKVKGKVDQEIKPGELISATIRKAGNGGATIDWNHSPKESKGNMYPSYVERRPDAFSTFEDACHALAQAFGVDSSIEEYEEDEPADKGKTKAA